MSPTRTSPHRSSSSPPPKKWSPAWEARDFAMLPGRLTPSESPAYIARPDRTLPSRLRRVYVGFAQVDRCETLKATRKRLPPGCRHGPGLHVRASEAFTEGLGNR